MSAHYHDENQRMFSIAFKCSTNNDDDLDLHITIAYSNQSKGKLNRECFSIFKDGDTNETKISNLDLQQWDRFEVDSTQQSRIIFVKSFTEENVTLIKKFQVQFDKGFHTTRLIRVYINQK